MRHERKRTILVLIVLNWANILIAKRLARMFRAGRWLCSRAASLTQSLAHQQSSVHESKLFLLTASSSSSLYQQHALGATPGPAPAGCTHLDAGFPLPGVHTIGERVAILQPAVSRAEEPFSQPTSSTFPLTEHFQDTYLHPDLRDRGRESSSTGLGSSSSTPSLEQGVTPTPRLDPVQGTAPASSSSGSMDLSPERLQEMQASYNQQQQARWQSWEPPDPALFRAQVEAELSAVESAAERAVQQAQQLLETRQADIIPGLGPLLRAWAAPVKEELDRELVKVGPGLCAVGAAQGVWWRSACVCMLKQAYLNTAAMLAYYTLRLARTFAWALCTTWTR